MSPDHRLRGAPSTGRHLLPDARRIPPHRAVAVVLSGTGANGSMGIKRIKELGGVTIVQDPDEAEYSGMPRNSIATSLVDHVLPVTDIPAPHPRLPRQPWRRAAARTESRPAAVRRAGSARDLRAAARQDRPRLLELQAGDSAAPHRPPHESERHHGDRRVCRASSASAPEEPQALLKDLLISVTNFFRDRAVFEILERRVVPKLFEGKDEDDQVRLWIAGCATGEEAYSIAMLLAEYAVTVPGGPAIQLFATDIDETAIAIAREGLYSLNDAADVSPERLRRFFVKEGESYRVRKELREMILFAHHNLIKDPPFSHLDLVSCRNLLIYLNRGAQKRVMEVIHFALNADGFLFLGSSESVEGSGDLFVSYEKDAGLFQSRAIGSRMAVPVPDLSRPDRLQTPEERASEQRARARLSAADLHLRLLEQYAPPSIVVNQDHEIVHLSDTAGRYMQYGGGEPSHNLMKAIRPELRIELRTALYQAAQQRTNVEAPGLVVRLDDRTLKINLIVRPVVHEDDTARGFFLVIFQEVPEGLTAEDHERAAPLSHRRHRAAARGGSRSRESAVARDDRAARDASGGAEGVERRAAGDERGAEVVG